MQQSRSGQGKDMTRLLLELESEESVEQRISIAQKIASQLSQSRPVLPEGFQDRIQALYQEAGDISLASTLLRISNRLKLLEKDIPIPEYHHLLPVGSSPEYERAFDTLRRVHDQGKEQEKCFHNRYTLQGVIAHGGMASVFKAVRNFDQQEVAIKFLADRYSAQAGIRARFEREYNLLSSLEHPNIIKVFDFGSDGGQWFIVMEYLSAGDLTRCINEDADVDRLLSIFQGVCSGLQAVHEQGIIHRDIKPQNILLGREKDEYVPRLTDFGLATDPGGSSLTSPEIKMGTVEYSAPEQLSSPAQVGQASDIYSLGVTVYYALSGGVLPSGDYPRLDEIQPGLSRQVQETVVKAMAQKPGDRWRSAAEFCRALCGAH
ncbi:MAG: serine/threonine-protein kinase [Desulfohalobiaceae bacterium]